MGYCISMPSKAEGGTDTLGVENRNESVRVYQQYHEDPPEVEPALFLHGKPGRSIEMTRPFLEELLAFFDNPENRKLCDLNVGPPLATAQ